MSRPEQIVFTASDAVQLHGRLFVPETPRALVLMCSAIGLRQQFYQSFARWLAEQGFAVMTFDYRGIGASLAESSPRYSKAKKQDWGLYDMPAALDYLVDRFPDLPAHLVGHSAGGQLLGLMSNYQHLSRVVTVGSTSGYVRNLPLGLRISGTFLFRVYVPLFARMLGYVPTSWIGWGEDLPARVALQWAAWCSKPGYVLNDFGVGIAEHYYSEIGMPILWLTAADDSIAIPENIEDILRLLERAPVTRQCINPAEYGLEHVGHIDFFRQRNAELWPIIADWLLE